MQEESIRRLDAGIIGMKPDVSLAEIASQVNREFCRIRIEDRDVWKSIIKSKDEGFADALLALFDLLGGDDAKL